MTGDLAVVCKAAEMVLRTQTGLISVLSQIITNQEAEEEIAAAPAAPPKAKGKSAK
jgi:hypothetical protein